MVNPPALVLRFGEERLPDQLVLFVQRLFAQLSVNPRQRLRPRVPRAVVAEVELDLSRGVRQLRLVARAAAVDQFHDEAPVVPAVKVPVVDVEHLSDQSHLLT